MLRGQRGQRDERFNQTIFSSSRWVEKSRCSAAAAGVSWATERWAFVMLQPNYQHFNRLKVRPIFMRSRAGFGGLLYTNRIIWPIRWATEQLQCFESFRGILEALTMCLSHDISLIKVGRGSAQCRVALQSDRWCEMCRWALSISNASSHMGKGLKRSNVTSAFVKGPTLCTGIIKA